MTRMQFLWYAKRVLLMQMYKKIQFNNYFSTIYYPLGKASVPDHSWPEQTDHQ
jgi:hypothetical protein